MARDGYELRTGEHTQTFWLRAVVDVSFHLSFVEGVGLPASRILVNWRLCISVPYVSTSLFCKGWNECAGGALWSPCLRTKISQAWSLGPDHEGTADWYSCNVHHLTFLRLKDIKHMGWASISMLLLVPLYSLTPACPPLSHTPPDRGPSRNMDNSTWARIAASGRWRWRPSTGWHRRATSLTCTSVSYMAWVDGRAIQDRTLFIRNPYGKKPLGARGKQRGFSPAAAARHRSRTTVPTDLASTFLSRFPEFFWNRTSPTWFFRKIWDRTMNIEGGFTSVQPTIGLQWIPISKKVKKRREKRNPPKFNHPEKGQNPRNSGLTPVARGGSGAPPPAARPTWTDMTMQFGPPWHVLLIWSVGPSRQISWRHECRDSMSRPPDCHKWRPLDSHLL